MNWRLKAIVQNLVDSLPPRLAYPAYYRLQRTFGGLRKGRIDPTPNFHSVSRLVDLLAEQGHSVRGARVMEVGTGRAVHTPLAFWLCGADKVYTVDLNPYLIAELVEESIDYIRDNRAAVERIFGAKAQDELFQERLESLLAAPRDLQQILRLTNIEYLAPADATRMGLPDDSIDLHVSVNVLEHIPSDVILAILDEARRLLRPGGVVAHYVDPSDHFSHSDSSITAVNFLQFDDDEWDRLAGNRFMYHNRLRAYEVVELFESLDYTIEHTEETTDRDSLDLLNRGFPLTQRYRGVSPSKLAVSRILIIARR